MQWAAFLVAKGISDVLVPSLKMRSKSAQDFVDDVMNIDC